MARIKFFIVACLALFAAVPANATTFIYTLTPVGAGNVYSFALPEQPTPTATIPLLGFLVANVPVQVGALSEIRNLLFLTTGGLQIRNAGTVELGLGATSNPKLFFGFPAHPTMKTGKFSLTGTGGAYSLNVVAVPEPATWLMLVLGIGLVGGTLRARRRPQVAVAA